METRLKKLERLNRILLAGVVVALLPWVVAAAEKIPDLIEGSGGKFKTVETRQLQLVDDAGNKVGGLTAAKDATNLAIKDSNGKNRIFIGFFKGNPSLIFADKEGRVVARFAETNGAFETVE